MKYPSIALALLLLAQTGDWNGTWRWATYTERMAYGESFIAQVAVIAREHCGQPYYGTVCE